MMHHVFTRRCLAAGAVCLGLVAWRSDAEAADTVRVAFGDIATVETLNFLTALERARKEGLDIETTFFKSEDIAAQAVVSGQADIGVGTPYALMQKVRAPIRMFFQMSTLQFYPVVDAATYQDWKDLDGEEIAVHSRGSGTEAIMLLMAKRNGIEYGQVSYVPGSEVRAGALLQGNIKASIVDSANRRLLDEKAPGKFKTLEVTDVEATDEALYANTDFLEGNQEAVDKLMDALLKTWRELDDDPKVVTEWRQTYNLLPDLPKDLEGEIVPYFEGAVEAGTFPRDGGSEAAARTDLEFYGLAGQLEGDPKSLNVEDFWTFEPLNRSLKRLGQG